MEPVGEELERLAGLRASGHLTEAEYEALKARILSGLIEEDSVESESPDDEPLNEPAAPGTEDDVEVEPPVVEPPTTDPFGAEDVQATKASEADRPTQSSEVGVGPARATNTSRYLLAFALVGVAALVAIVVIQNRDDDNQWREYNPYCEASDGCYDTNQTPSVGQTPSSGLVPVDFWPVVDETTCISRGTGVMNCLVGIGNYAGESVNCLAAGIMGWTCIAYVPD
jgi:hypothetical protein